MQLDLGELEKLKDENDLIIKKGESIKALLSSDGYKVIEEDWIDGFRSNIIASVGLTNVDNEQIILELSARNLFTKYLAEVVQSITIAENDNRQINGDIKEILRGYGK